MKKSITIAIACAIGAGLGTMLALSFESLWVFGLIIGAIGGYLIYDFPVIIAAIPNAIKLAYGFVYAQDRKGVSNAIVYKLKMLLSAMVFIVIIIGYSLLISKQLEQPNEFALLKVLLTGINYYWAVVLIVHVINFTETGSIRIRRTLRFLKPLKLVKVVFWAKKSQSFGLFVILFVPIVAFAVSSYWLLEKIFLVLPVSIYKMIHFAGRFLWELFKLIHSDIRLLVGIDSFIGAYVGFYFGNILIGMVAGAVFGFINYYFVSIKWLKLQPKH